MSTHLSEATQTNKGDIGKEVKRSVGRQPTLLHNRGFKLLWIGEGISLIGDQFYMIALPWLVLQLTGDALAMSTVLALAGIPRALFMLVGGAITDRFNPRLVMLVSNLLRLILVSLLAILVISGTIQVWMLYVFALVFGLMDAFFFPAQNAIVPSLVKEDHLQTANAIIQGTMQLSLFVGPVLAGTLISWLDTSSSVQTAGNLQGIGFAFAIDALTFLASAVTLWQIRVGEAEHKKEEEDGIFASIRAGLVYVWKDVSLRTFFFIIAMMNFLVTGPLTVGIPVLADTRLAEGAAAFGILMSAYGGGSLLGIVLAGALPKPPEKRLGILLGIVSSGIGFGVMGLGLITTTTAGAIVTLLTGAANGYVAITFITWLQKRTKAEMIGRIMSLLMFSAAGLGPISVMITGAVIRGNPVSVFLTAGGLMTLSVLLMILNPAIRSIEPVLLETMPSTD
jgi:MFS family permease